MQSVLYFFCTYENKLSHIERQTFSAVSSFSFSNDVFTSAFDNYKILLELTNTTNNEDVLIRFRVAGVSATTNNFNRQTIFGSSTTISGNRLSSSSSGRIGNVSSETGRSVISCELFSPKLTLPTNFLSLVFLPSDGAILNFHGGNFTLTTSFDSIQILNSGGNMTGKADLYGYAK